MRTDVAIVGASPAGLLLGHLLRSEGVRCVVIERRVPEYILGRIRAGVLERGTVGLMERLGLDARLKTEGLPRRDGRFPWRTPGLTARPSSRRARRPAWSAWSATPRGSIRRTSG